LSSLFLITKEEKTAQKLQSDLAGMGFNCTSATVKEKVMERIVRESPELVMLEMDGPPSQTILRDLTRGGKLKARVPILALVGATNLGQPADYAGVDDFVLWPYERRELAFRLNRLLQKNARQDEILDLGELIIDLANCEVRVEGKVVELTFKEYELLKFLARDPGRVFTREALLNQVWGYDYFGGDRTVDVHIRRLRSKIELSGQTFIETVRNIGYRFKKPR
jgi:two-component system alkaline phosphatase synthesis response regulator PhoP